jgi:cytochrome c peroxidase
MNDGFGNPKNTKSMLYTHATPPAMITAIRPNAETAVRAGFKHIQFFDIPEQEAIAVDAYLSSLTPVASPYLKNGKLSKSAKSGKVIFDRVSCAHCHSGSYFTNLKKYEMGIKDTYDKQNSWDTPTLIELWRTAPYLHSGKYADLKDVFKIEQHGIEEPLPEQDIKDLVEYISSL